MNYTIGLSSGTLEALRSLGIKGAEIIKDSFYPIYVKQAFVLGIVPIPLMIVGTILIIILLKTASKYNALENSDETGYRHQGNEFQIYSACYIISGVLGLFLLTGICCYFSECLPMLLNPEYYAIQRLLGR